MFEKHNVIRFVADFSLSTETFTIILIIFPEKKVSQRYVGFFNFLYDSQQLEKNFFYPSKARFMLYNFGSKYIL